jgi:hypothetical protein
VSCRVVGQGCEAFCKDKDDAWFVPSPLRTCATLAVAPFSASYAINMSLGAYI